MKSFRGKLSLIKITIIIISCIIITSLLLVACKSKKKNSEEGPKISAPTLVTLKAPLVAVSFQRTPTITVGGVEEGDTVQLFKDQNCRPSDLVASGEVGSGQTSIDLTTDNLSTTPTNYRFSAKRTNAEGTSTCSAMAAAYQIIACPPEMYLPIEGNFELGTDAFCVMQTEAKQGANDIPSPQYAELPWVSITPPDAKAACKRIPIEHGSCDIISNAQWMTIARELEAQDANWKFGTVGNSVLRAGHSDSNPSVVLSISDPNDPLDQTNNDENSWLQQRTNVTSYGDIIWDFAGNADEWADWETGGDTFGVGPNTCLPTALQPNVVECEDLAFNDYMPLNPAGLNYYYYEGKIFGTEERMVANGSGGAARRGGCAQTGEKLSGIYQLSLANGIGHVNPVVGFRCVCTVYPE